MKKVNLKFVSLIIICITIFSSIGVFSYFIYHKEELKQDQQNQRLEKEQENRDYYREQLTNCINTASINRTNLWNSNCPNGNSNCKLDSKVVEWIDNRYQQEVNECKMKWNY